MKHFQPQELKDLLKKLEGNSFSAHIFSEQYSNDNLTDVLVLKKIDENKWIWVSLFKPFHTEGVVPFPKAAVLSEMMKPQMGIETKIYSGTFKELCEYLKFDANIPSWEDIGDVISTLLLIAEKEYSGFADDERMEKARSVLMQVKNLFVNLVR